MLLLIDTAGPWCRLALAEESGIVARRAREMARGQDAALFADLSTLMEGRDPAAITAVAVNAGPGGFTGLRLGVAAAAGLAAGLGVPVIGVPTGGADGAPATDEEALSNLLTGALARLDRGEHGVRPVYAMPPRADPPRHAPPPLLPDRAD